MESAVDVVWYAVRLVVANTCPAIVKSTAACPRLFQKTMHAVRVLPTAGEDFHQLTVYTRKRITQNNSTFTELSVGLANINLSAPEFFLNFSTPCI